MKQTKFRNIELINRVNNTKSEYPHKNVCQLFEESVSSNPNKICLITNVNNTEKNYTYREVNAMAEVLASMLAARGICKNAVVGILSKDKTEVILSMVAILKLGGVYLPLDSEWPVPRLQYILEDSDCSIVISSVSDHELETVFEKFLCIDFKQLDKAGPGLYHKINYGFEEPAYIMYTSGTSSAPKGVVVSHRNIVRLVINTNFIKIEKSDILAQTGAITFDASTFEIWGALLNSAGLYIIEKAALLDYDKLRQSICGNNITVMFLTTTLFHNIADLRPSVFEGLRCLLVGGERLAPHYANIVRERYTDLTVLNCYGPTENTVFSTFYNITDKCEKFVPIGEPVSNSSVYIVNTDGELCDIGETGEIWVGGDGVAKGYINKKELTKEKFIANPFSDTDKNGHTGLVYRTGDLGRWTDEYVIEFLARIDSQIKLRGFRIELDEIENTLLRLEKIKDAAVILADGEEKYLEVYVVLKDNAWKEFHIRQYLKQLLPRYMIPKKVTIIEKIPLNENGKTDRNKLLQESLKKTAEIERMKKVNKLDNSLEEQLAQIWKENLSLDTIGSRDDYFELGGDSLNCIRLINKINRHFHVKAEVAEIFQHSRLEDMALYIGGLEHINYSQIKQSSSVRFYPLSSAQKRLFTIRQYNQDSIAYNETFCFYVKGSLQKNRLEQALVKIMERHEIFRTSIVFHENEPVQYIMDSWKPVIEYINCEEKDLRKYIRAFIRPFDFSLGKLFRTALIEVGRDRFYLVFDFHHIVIDGTSIGVFMDELIRLYSGDALPELKLQYKDYCVWQTETGRKLDSQKKFWLNMLKDFDHLLELPYDYSITGKEQDKGAVYKFSLGREQTDKVKNLAISNNVTVFMIFLAEYFILLSKICNETGITVGIPVANRVHKDVDSMMGMFVNTLPLRLSVDFDYSFQEFLDRVKFSFIEMLENQECQLEDVIHSLGIKSRSIDNPLFNSVFVYQNINLPGEIQTEELYIQPVEVERNTAKFDLSLELFDNNGCFDFVFEYRTGIFKEETIGNVADYIININRRIVEKPDEVIKNIRLITETERNKILYEFNKGVFADLSSYTMAGLFQEAVGRRPEKTALISGNRKMSYKELDRLSDGAAANLMKSGFKKGEIIAVLCDRSFNDIIIMTAAVKTGLVYLPIEKGTPYRRVEFMLRDSRCRVLVLNKTDMDYVNCLEKEQIDVVIMTGEELISDSTGDDTAWFELKQEFLAHSRGEDLVNIIYTSGSTGRPKGTQIMQKGILRLVLDEQLMQIDENDCWLRTASMSFDASTWEIWTSLFKGITLYLTGKEELTNVWELGSVIKNHNISIVFLTTPLFNQLALENAEIFKKIKYLATGGDVVSPKSVKNVLEVCPGLKIVNAYGPTENTVISTSCIIEGKWDERCGVPIGRPAANTKAYILGRDSNILPIGLKGELCFSGDGVAAGYLNREELNKEKFCDNPFDEGGKLYRTGDYAKWLPNGEIAFYGRIDRQIKLNGFRIELKETEFILTDHENIRNAIVIIRDCNGSKYLTAFLIYKIRMSEDEVKGYLTEYLPEYMIPKIIIPLESFPINAAGKIDMELLNTMELKEALPQVLPGSQSEAALLNMWKRELNNEKIGIEDNLFEIGGHSIRAMKIVNMIEQEFRKRINMNIIYKYPTVKSLAGYLDEISNFRSELLDKLTKTEEKDYYKASVAQSRIYDLFLSEPSNSEQNLPHKMLIAMPFREETFKEAFLILLKRHESLRIYFGTVNNQTVQFINTGMDIEYEIIDLVKQTPKERRKITGDITERERKIPFNLHVYPLFRIKIFQYGDQFELFLLINHIITDGWSLYIFEKEFNTVYQALQQHREVMLPDIKYRFVDYTEWHNAVINNSAETKPFKEYYIRQLGHTRELISLSDKAAEEGEALTATAMYRTVINTELTEKLKEAAISNKSSLFIILLSALTITAGKRSGKKKFIMGLPCANRHNKELEKIFGYFVDPIAICVENDESFTWKEYIRSLADKVFKTLPYSIYPLEYICKAIGIRCEGLKTFKIWYNMTTFEDSNQKVLYDFKDYHNLNSQNSKFEFALYPMEFKNGIELTVYYFKDLFSPEAVVGIMKQYISLLDDFIHNADKSLAHILEEQTDW